MTQIAADNGIFQEDRGVYVCARGRPHRFLRLKPLKTTWQP